MNKYSLSTLLNQEDILNLFDIFESENKEVRLVGGCVRDALLGIKTKDIDVAAKIHPDDIINILKKHNIKHENFAYKYGSILATIKGQKFQITSLREDVNQMGRNTNIIFTQDWRKDSLRRDFTINSIYLKSSGDLVDYFDGQKDLAEFKLKFIGNIEDRIKEDYLRIFRYYRFIGLFEEPKIIKDYEKIIQNYFSECFIYLPNDLLRQEILKMFLTPFPLNCFFTDNNKNKKKYWVDLTKKHFIKNQYDIGLRKCLNKIELLIC